MIKDLISIILPVYNSEKYIAKCLEALISQTYENIEIICINDGSTDKSLEILEEYAKKDSRIKLISNKNSGPATSRNIGLKNATGEFLMFCDSDDTYRPQMCEKMIEAIKKYDVDFVTCRASVEYEGDIIRLYTANTMTHQLPVGINKIESTKINDLSSLLWHKIYRKSIVDKYNITFPDGLECDDVLFNHQYYTVSNRFYEMKDSLYNYLVRHNSIMDNYQKRVCVSKLYDRIRIFEHFNKFLEQNKLKEKKEFYYLNLLFYQYLYAKAVMLTEEEQAKLVEETIKVANYMPKHKGNLFYFLEKKSTAEIDEIIKQKTHYELIYGNFSPLRRIKLLWRTIVYYNKYYRL